VSAELQGYFTDPFEFAGKRISGRFVIPSGIRCTHASTIARCFADVGEIGIITTKSISVLPRPGYREPIYARFSAGSYINAVGLTNPGAEAFRGELEEISIPADKFLLVSILGTNAQEYAQAASILRPVADGFELNMSCPHAAGYGMEIGQDAELVAAITRAVVDAAGVPVIVKLSAMLPRIQHTAELALAAGAVGVTLINTIGPSMVRVGLNPILSNRVGGLSGNAVRPLGLRSVESVRSAIGPGPVIIGMGGIGTAEHVLQFRACGADVFGVGSALTGLDSDQMKVFFAGLQSASLTGKPASLGSDSSDTPLNMDYHSTRVVERIQYTDDLFGLALADLPGDPAPGDMAGKYYFLTVPGIGEKPFAVFSAAQRTVIIKVIGKFTAHLNRVKVGDELLLRGPYGKHIGALPGCDGYVLVGGGTGIASLLEVGYALRGTAKLRFVLGARNQAELFGVDAFRNLGEVMLATDDGSCGHHGTVSPLLQEILDSLSPGMAEGLAFVNCGPEPMIKACIALQRRHVPSDRILSAVEYHTSCGVGICGKCASPSGHLSCIDGPFMFLPAFEPRPAAPKRNPDHVGTETRRKAKEPAAD
jgi:dihydroorotate dehydrogenase (NAD+) catalytic subunit